MPSAVFKHAIPASNWPQTHALDHIAIGQLPYAIFSPEMSSLKHKFAVTQSAVYCTLDHFTFSHLGAICHTKIQYTAFKTLSHVILLKQKNENQKFTQCTTPFPNLDKTACQLR
jgi:hypothetical protein